MQVRDAGANGWSHSMCQQLPDAPPEQVRKQLGWLPPSCARSMPSVGTAASPRLADEG